MTQKIILFNYLGERKEFNIPDFENVLCINILVITGDEEAQIIYKNFDVKVFYACPDCNCFGDLFDGSYVIKPNEIEEFNNFAGDIYDRLCYFEKKRCGNDTE